MPLYEYECEACGHRFEAIQKFSDPPLDKCPKCGGHPHKLIAAPAFKFKGSGWYITDYAKKDSPSATSGESKSGSTAGEAAASDKSKETAKASSASKADTSAAPTKTGTTSTKD